MVKKLRELVTTEIEEIREKTGTINLLISGGIDSGVLAALAKPDNLFTVHLPFGPKHDEIEDTLKTVDHLGLRDRLWITELDINSFDEDMQVAVKAIGRPISHYNIFPLYQLFKQLSLRGITDVVVGDGPDESMCCYTRHLILGYVYGVYEMEVFKQYEGMVDKLLEFPPFAYSRMIGKPTYLVEPIFYEIVNQGKNFYDFMCKTDMLLMRPDMDDMSDGIARHFGITIHRPYQVAIVDEFMFNLPKELKVKNNEFGKYLLRKLAAHLLPPEIAWRLQKIGGPVVPVNEIKGWDLDPFDKSKYLQYQKEILNA
jgi:asparagine synthetase B (glutamine-hydrolysing)